MNQAVSCQIELSLKRARRSPLFHLSISSLRSVVKKSSLTFYPHPFSCLCFGTVRKTCYMPWIMVDGNLWFLKASGQKLNLWIILLQWHLFMLFDFFILLLAYKLFCIGKICRKRNVEMLGFGFEEDAFGPTNPLLRWWERHDIYWAGMLGSYSSWFKVLFFINLLVLILDSMSTS